MNPQKDWTRQNHLNNKNKAVVSKILNYKLHKIIKVY